jgi:hypothetical protein
MHIDRVNLSQLLPANSAFKWRSYRPHTLEIQGLWFHFILHSWCLLWVLSSACLHCMFCLFTVTVFHLLFSICIASMATFHSICCYSSTLLLFSSIFVAFAAVMSSVALHICMRVIPDWRLIDRQRRVCLLLFIWTLIESMFFKNFHTCEKVKRNSLSSNQECSTCNETHELSIFIRLQSGSVLWAFCTCCWSPFLSIFLISKDSVDVMRSAAFFHLFIFLTLLQPSH